MLRVGVHPNNLHLRLARLLAAGESPVTWVDYADGRETGDLIQASAVDFGGTGSTPPLTAQARGIDLVYVAASAPRPANAGVLVRRGSGIAAAADLAGRSVALIEGSFHTALLAVLAERQGFELSAVRRVDLAPAASAEALRAGAVDAWIAMDPHLGGEGNRGEFAVLPDAAGLIPNRSLFWTSRAVAESRAEEVAGALALLARVAAWVRADPASAAGGLAAEGGADAAGWSRILASRDWTLHAVGPEILAEQQAEADCLARHGLMPPITVAEAAPPRLLAAAA